jgi:hypothetical protein
VEYLLPETEGEPTEFQQEGLGGAELSLYGDVSAALFLGETHGADKMPRSCTTPR